MLKKALRLLRVFNDMSQTEMAHKLGVTKSWISEIENGHKEPTLNLLQGYAEVLDIPLSSIMFFSEHIDSAKPSDRTRAFVSKKILAILEYIAKNSEDEDEKGAERKVSA